jgi:uncharacterized protein (DUF2147 family)
MRHKLILLITILFYSLNFANGQTAEADKLLGVWEVGSGKARVKIDKYGEKYMGKIVWLREPKYPDGTAKVDKNNPDEKLRTKPLLGYQILLGFEYKGDMTWENGTIYDAENGSNYMCTIKMPDNNTLDVRGYIGVSLFGRTDMWKRVELKKK